MYLNRWKVLACTLTVGVGGLAVFATDPASKSEAPKEPEPLPKLTVKPATPANGTDTPAPAIPAIPAKGEEFEITVPFPPAPAKADEPDKKPAADGPVFVPVDAPPAPVILPVKGEAEPKDAKKPEPAKTDDLPPVAVPPVPTKPEVKEAPKPPVPVIPLPVVTDKVKPEAPKPPTDLLPPPVKVPAVDVPPPPLKPDPPPATMPPVPSVVVPAPAKKPEPVTPPLPAESPKAPEAVKVPISPMPDKAADGARLKMLLRMGDGQPRFEIRTAGTTELLLKVWGEKIEMAAPPDARSTLAGVTAIGRVRFTAPGIEGTCDHLSILSATGEVLLKGNIHLKARHGKTWSEMTAEKMVYQIGTAGLSAPGTPKVTPAAYLPE